MVIVLMAIALALRWPGLSHGYTADELGTVMPGGAWAIFTDPETGVNPPLWRMMFNAPFEDADAPRYGRWFSLLCSVGVVPLGFWGGRLAGGRLAGWLAAAFFAVNPVMVLMGTIFRIYAWWSAVAALHLVALVELLQAPVGRRRTWTALVVATGVLLPWIHYFSVPFLLILGLGVALGFPGRRGTLACWVPAAVGVMPLVRYVLEDHQRRTLTPERLDDTLSKIVGMGLHPPPWLSNDIGKAIRASGIAGLHHDDTMALVVGAVILVHLLAWRRLGAGRAVFTLASLAVVISVAALARVQYVRLPTAVFMATASGPLLASFAGTPRTRAGRAVAASLVAILFGAAIPDRLERLGRDAERWDALPHLAERIRGEADAWSGATVYLYPAYEVGSLYFYVEGRHVSHRGHPPPCEGFSWCFLHGEVRVVGLDNASGAARVDGLLASVDRDPPAGFGQGCVPVLQEPGLRLFDCRDRSSSDDGTR